MEQVRDIPLFKSYNKDTTIIEGDPFMGAEIGRASCRERV